MSVTTKRLERRTIREQLADLLRQAILDMEYKPGERLVEEDISRKFQVSRGPVRETLRQLEQEGLVQYETNKGCTVKSLTYEEMVENSLIRCNLEILAVKAFSGRMSRMGLKKLHQYLCDLGTAGEERKLAAVIAADESFHQTIVEEAHFPRLLQMWKLTSAASMLEFYTMDSREMMPYESLYRNHKWIFDVFDQQKDLAEIVEMIDAHYMVVPEDLFFHMTSGTKGELPLNGKYKEFFDRLRQKDV